MLRDAEVAGSNPVASMNQKRYRKVPFSDLYIRGCTCDPTAARTPAFGRRGLKASSGSLPCGYACSEPTGAKRRPQVQILSHRVRKIKGFGVFPEPLNRQ